MIAAQQRSDIQRATASLAAFRNFRVQNEKHYKDRELEEMYTLVIVGHKSMCEITNTNSFNTGDEKKFGNHLRRPIPLLL